MWTASHQLDDLSLDLMHGGAREDERVMRQPVHTESSQKRLCCEGKKIVSVNQRKRELNIFYVCIS